MPATRGRTLPFRTFAPSASTGSRSWRASPSSGGSTPCLSSRAVPWRASPTPPNALRGSLMRWTSLTAMSSGGSATSTPAWATQRSTRRIRCCRSRWSPRTATTDRDTSPSSPLWSSTTASTGAPSTVTRSPRPSALGSLRGPSRRCATWPRPTCAAAGARATWRAATTSTSGAATRSARHLKPAMASSASVAPGGCTLSAMISTATRACRSTIARRRPTDSTSAPATDACATTSRPAIPLAPPPPTALRTTMTSSSSATSSTFLATTKAPSRRTPTCRSGLRWLTGWSTPPATTTSRRSASSLRAG
mmetsp:Transcript_72798/g.229314  ORF Transcript_72798/g.229314 Transcript_72798/m.229314 type:complete len:307 (-) Transcript_72798:928-1848(-)